MLELTVEASIELLDWTVTVEFTGTSVHASRNSA